MKILKKMVEIPLRLLAKLLVHIINLYQQAAFSKEIIGDELSKVSPACIHGIRKSTNATISNFKTLDKSLIVDKITNFEDIFWLFNCNYANRGIIAQDFDEAAYIFKTLRARSDIQYMLEIGRFLGGSTFLMATAKNKETNFVSVDLKVKTPDYADDQMIKTMIDLVDPTNTQLVISDSRTYIPKNKLDFIFIDGDHSYAGVKADYNHYETYLNENCDVLFHDAVSSRNFCTKHDEVYKFMLELEKNSKLKFIKDIGSIRHYKYLGGK